MKTLVAFIVVLCYGVLATVPDSVQQESKNLRMNLSASKVISPRRVRRSSARPWRYDDDLVSRSSGRRFNKAVLSWRISKYLENSDLNREDIRHAITSAIRAWSEAVEVQFQEVSSSDTWSTVDIEFRFLDSSFDDIRRRYIPADVLTNFGTKDNQEGVFIHFNGDVDWVIGGAPSPSVDLFTVVLHEIGHALGLGHSQQRHDVMYEVYTRRIRRLTSGDIQAAQQVLKSSRITRVVIPQPPPGSCTPGRSYCSNQLRDLGYGNLEANNLYKCNSNGVLSIDTYCSHGCNTIDLDMGCACAAGIWYCRARPPVSQDLIPEMDDGLQESAARPPNSPDSTSTGCQLYAEVKRLNPLTTERYHSYCRNPSVKCQQYCTTQTRRNGQWLQQRNMDHVADGEIARVIAA